MPEDAVMDSVEESPVDSTPEDSSPAEPSTPVETPETPVDPNQQQVQQAKRFISEDGKRLEEHTRQLLNEIKAKDPAAAKAFQSALFAQAALKREFPGGLQEASQLKAQLAEIGAPLAEVKAELQGWNDIDRKFTEGDPGFIAELAAGSPESFVKLMGPALDKYRELSPDGYNAHIASTILADMQQNKLFVAFARLGDRLPAGDETVNKLWEEISGYISRLEGLASKPITAVAKKEAPAANPEQDQLRQENENLKRQGWAGQASSQRSNAYNLELSKLLAGQKVSDTQKAAIAELYATRMQQAYTRRGVNQSLDSFFKAGDQTGFLKHLASVDKEEIPRVLRSVIDALIPGRKPAVAPPRPASGPIKPPVAGQAVNGWQPVTARPAANEVDQIRTTQDMWMAKTAILTSGKRVKWA